MPPRPAPDGPRVKLTLGKCLFTGMFECPCTAGSVVANLKDLVPDSQCEKCGHAVSLHQEVNVDESPSDRPRALPAEKRETRDLLLLSTPPENSSSLFKTDPASSPARPQQRLFVNEKAASNNDELSLDSFHRQQVSYGNGGSQSVGPFVGNTGYGFNRQTAIGGNSPFQSASDTLDLAQPNEFHNTAIYDNSTYICARAKTVCTIASMVGARGAVLIWGLPGSGKSTLGKLVFEHLIKQDTQTVFIDNCLTAKNGKLEESLAEFCQYSYPGTSSEDVINGEFVFIIDEAHKSLQKLKRLIKTVITTGKGPKFCMLSDQGVCADRNSVFEILPEVSYLATHGACADNVGIFYTRSEFEEVVAKMTAKSMGYKLTKEAENHIFSLTAGHPAIVRSVLCYVDMVYSRIRELPI